MKKSPFGMSGMVVPEGLKMLLKRCKKRKEYDVADGFPDLTNATGTC